MNAAWPGPTHPTGPAGPSPSGPAGPAPSPTGPGLLPSAGTGAPWPSRPQGPTGPTGPSGPGRGSKAADAALLADIDSALVGLLTVAYFSPTVRSTSASVRQVCAAEVLLHRLRAARNAVRELADAYGIESPARQVSNPSAGPEGAPGGPVQLGFRLPRDIRTDPGPPTMPTPPAPTPRIELGRGAQYDALPLSPRGS